MTRRWNESERTSSWSIWQQVWQWKGSKCYIQQTLSSLTSVTSRNRKLTETQHHFSFPVNRS